MNKVKHWLKTLKYRPELEAGCVASTEKIVEFYYCSQAFSESLKKSPYTLQYTFWIIKLSLIWKLVEMNDKIFKPFLVLLQKSNIISLSNAIYALLFQSDMFSRCFWMQFNHNKSHKIIIGLSQYAWFLNGHILETHELLQCF